VLRRALASLVLIALAGSPAVSSTRLFCRYSGIEIVGCEESQVPAQAQIRDEGCCLKRTSYAIDPTRVSPDDGSLLVAPMVAVVTTIPGVLLLRAPAPSTRANRPGGAGPPVFLTNRALLI
jgi:hypothetical protein